MGRTEADPDTLDGAVVRKALCELPPSRKLHMQVKDQFTEFGQDSWVSEQKQKGKAW